MTLNDRIANLEQIVARLRQRREEVEDQLERADVPAGGMVNFRVQIAAQLSVLDDTIRRLKRRIRDLRLVEQLGQGVRKLSAAQITAMNKALAAVNTAIKATTALKDVVKVVQSAAKAALKAGEAAAPVPA